MGSVNRGAEIEHHSGNAAHGSQANDDKSPRNAISTSSETIDDDPSNRDSAAEMKATKKRNRMIISCTSCRRKKIRCDREKPICSSCKARNYSISQCVYNEVPETEGIKKPKLSKSPLLVNLSASVVSTALTLQTVINSDGTNTSKSKLKPSSITNSLSSIPSDNKNIFNRLQQLLQIAQSRPITDPEAEYLEEELKNVCQRKLLLDDFAKSITTTHAEDTQYLTLKVELLSRENEILNVLNTHKSVQLLKSSSTGSVRGTTTSNNSALEIENTVLFQKLNVSIIYAIRFKPNRTIYFGPTCFRSAIAYNSHFSQIYQFISKLTTRDRKHFKNSRRLMEISSYFPFNIDKYYELGCHDPSTGTKPLKPLQVHDNPMGIHNVEDFIVRLINFLPKYSDFVYHINQFFDKLLDKLYPIVVKSYVFEVFNEIVKPKTEAEKLDTSDPNKNDFKIILSSRYRDCSGIALILSMVKISLLYTDNAFNSINPLVPNDEVPKVESLLSYFTGQFLSLLKLMKRPLISSLQTLIFIKIDKMYHLNEGEGGDSSDGHLMHSLAFTMAVMCGLHRDIDRNYREGSLEHRNMLKNIWKYLTLIDWKQSFDLGYPLHIDDLRFSETTARNIFDYYKDEINIFEINRQFQILNFKANLDGDYDELLFDYFLPIVRHLSYQLNTLHGENLTLFKLEIYVQNFIQFYCNANFFQPLFELLTNPIVQDNQLPKNGFKFVKFIKKIKLQIAIINTIFTLYNLILMILQRLDENVVQDPDISKLVNFYGNQAVNFVVFIIKFTKKFLDIKAKDKIFQIYLFESMKKTIHRCSNFVYSNLLFSYNGKEGSFGAQDFHNNFDCYFNVNKNLIRNIRANNNDEFLNNTSVHSFRDEDFDRICFSNNQYELVNNGDDPKQFENFRRFVKNDYVHYNFYNKKLELSNLIFEFFFKNVKENLKDYYVFYVVYKISMHFYSYLKDRNLVKNMGSTNETSKQDKETVKLNKARDLSRVASPREVTTVSRPIMNTAANVYVPINGDNPPNELNNAWPQAGITTTTNQVPMANISSDSTVTGYPDTTYYPSTKFDHPVQYVSGTDTPFVDRFNAQLNTPISILDGYSVSERVSATRDFNNDNVLLFSNLEGAPTTTNISPLQKMAPGTTIYDENDEPAVENKGGVTINPDTGGEDAPRISNFVLAGFPAANASLYDTLGDKNGILNYGALVQELGPSSQQQKQQQQQQQQQQQATLPFINVNAINADQEYNPLNLLSDDFYIDVDDLFNQINSQY